jgi:hypothetical protein
MPKPFVQRLLEGRSSIPPQQPLHHASLLAPISMYELYKHPFPVLDEDRSYLIVQIGERVHNSRIAKLKYPGSGVWIEADVVEGRRKSSLCLHCTPASYHLQLIHHDLWMLRAHPLDRQHTSGDYRDVLPPYLSLVCCSYLAGQSLYQRPHRRGEACGKALSVGSKVYDP